MNTMIKQRLYDLAVKVRNEQAESVNETLIGKERLDELVKECYIDIRPILQALINEKVQEAVNI